MYSLRGGYFVWAKAVGRAKVKSTVIKISFFISDNLLFSPDGRLKRDGVPAVLRSDGHEGRRYEMTGPESLSMAEIAERISAAIGEIVRYVNVTPSERRQAMLAAGLPTYIVDALDEQAEERRRCPESRVDLSTHTALGIRPTTFSEFARTHAQLFVGKNG